MPTRKIRELDKDEVCRDSDHIPPSYKFYDEGVYEHICPSCGKKTEFKVVKPRYY